MKTDSPINSQYVLFRAPEGSTLNNNGLCQLQLDDGTRYSYDVAVPYTTDEQRAEAFHTYGTLRQCEVVVDGLDANKIAAWPMPTIEKKTVRYHEIGDGKKTVLPVMSCHM